MAKWVVPKVVLASIVLSVYCTNITSAQIISGAKVVFFQATAKYDNKGRDFHNIGPGIREIVQSRIWDYFISINPAWWIGDHTAIELEFGYWHSKVQTGSEGRIFKSSYDATMIIPHLVLSASPFDSTLTPYVRGGIGIFSFDETAGHPLGFSLGAGCIYDAGHSLLFRCELNYRAHSSTSGSNVVVQLDWSGVNILLGLGLRF